MALPIFLICNRSRPLSASPRCFIFGCPLCFFCSASAFHTWHARSNPQGYSCVVKNVQNVGLNRCWVGDGYVGGSCHLCCDEFLMYDLLCVGQCFGDGFAVRHSIWHRLRLVLYMVALSQTGNRLRCPPDVYRHFVPWYVDNIRSRFRYSLRRGAWLWFLLVSRGQAFRCELAGVIVREFYCFDFSLCGRFPFDFILLEVALHFDLYYAKFL